MWLIRRLGDVGWVGKPGAYLGLMNLIGTVAWVSGGASQLQRGINSKHQYTGMLTITCLTQTF